MMSCNKKLYYGLLGCVPYFKYNMIRYDRIGHSMLYDMICTFLLLFNFKRLVYQNMSNKKLICIA